MSSPHIVEGGIFEESREWPHHQRALKSSPKLCRLIDIFAQPRSKSALTYSTQPQYLGEAAPSMRATKQTHTSALKFYARSRSSSARASSRYSSSRREAAPPLPKSFQIKHPVSYPPVSMIPANARQPVDYAAGGRTPAASSSLRVDGVAGGPTVAEASAPTPSPRPPRRRSAAGFQKQADATGREYLVDKLTGAWTPVAELTNNAPVSPLRDGEDAAMYQRPSACHPSATTSHKKRGRDEMGPFRTGKPADDDTSIVSSENSQKSLHDEVAQLRARLDAVERRTAADLLAMETVISWLKDNHDRTQQSLESLARGVTP